MGRTFDSNGNITKKTEYQDGKKILYIKEYTNGKITKRTEYYYWNSQKLFYIEEYTNGNITKRTYYFLTTKQENTSKNSTPTVISPKKHIIILTESFKE